MSEAVAKAVPADKKIVVVGGGYGGLNLAKLLQESGASVTLIDAKDAFHHNVAAVRAVVEEGFTRKCLIPYAPTFGENFKQGVVTKLDLAGKNVILGSGEKVPYNILVLATGCMGDFPTKVGRGTRDDAIKKYLGLIEQVKAAKKIAVIGGGAAGVEIAGEIATDFPDKTVTVFHSSTNLINDGLGADFQKKIKQILTDLKVNLVLGELVSNLKDLSIGKATVKTEKGTVLDVDLVIPCIGLKVDKEAFQDTLASAMTERIGSLKVNEYFEVEGQEDLYAIGDVTDIKETKLAFHASRQAVLLAQNMAKKYNGEAAAQEKYVPGIGMPMKMLVSVGRNAAVGETHEGVVPDKINPKGLFEEYYWGMVFKQDIPS